MVRLSEQSSFEPSPAKVARVGTRAHLASLVALILGAVVITASILAITAPLFSVNFPFAYGEGPIVRDAWLLSHGELFYRKLGESPPYSLSNYTPLYYSILGGILHFTGLSFLPGRFLSLMMGIGVLFFVYRIVSFYSGDKQSGFAASLVLLASPFAGNLALNRVDATAAFFSVGAIAVLLTRPRTHSVALIAGTLAACAALTRQTSFIFPLLVAGGVYFREKRLREFGIFVLVLGFIAGGVSTTLELASARAYSFNIILSNINSFEWDRLVLAIGSIGQSFYGPLIALIFILFRKQDVRAHRPLLGILVIAALPSFVAIAKSGSNLNYLIESYVVLALIFGIVVGSLSDRRKKAFFLSVIIGVVAVPHIESARQLPKVVARRSLVQEEAARHVRLVRNLPSVVLSDDLMGVELLAGKKIFIQPYEVNQLQRHGQWRDRGVRKILRTRQAGVILISSPYSRAFIRRERWTRAQWRLLRRNYRVGSMTFGSVCFMPL